MHLANVVFMLYRVLLFAFTRGHKCQVQQIKNTVILLCKFFKGVLGLVGSLVIIYLILLDSPSALAQFSFKSAVPVNYVKKSVINR